MANSRDLISKFYKDVHRLANLAKEIETKEKHNNPKAKVSLVVRVEGDEKARLFNFFREHPDLLPYNASLVEADNELTGTGEVLQRML